MSFCWNLSQETNRNVLFEDDNFIVEKSEYDPDYAGNEMMTDNVRLKSDPEAGGQILSLRQKDGNYYLYECGWHSPAFPIAQYLNEKYGEPILEDDDLEWVTEEELEAEYTERDWFNDPEENA